MLNLNSRIFEPRDGKQDPYVKFFTKTWAGGGVFGSIVLYNNSIDVNKVGNYLSQSVLDLVMNTVEEDRIKLLEYIINELVNQYKTIHSSENVNNDENNLRISILLFIDDNVYVGLKGKSGCYVERNGKILNFSSLIEENSLKVVSGKLQSKDYYLLSPLSDLPTDKIFEDSLERLLVKYFMVVGDKNSINNFANVVDEFELNTMEEDDGRVEEFEEDENEEDRDDEESLSNLSEENGLSKALEVDESENHSIDDTEVSNIEPTEIPTRTNRTKEMISKSQLIAEQKIIPRLKILFSKVFKLLGYIGTWVFETIVGFGGRSKYQTEGIKKLKTRRIILTICIIVMSLVLFLSISWIRNTNASREMKELYTREYSRIEDTIKQAESLASYNSTEAMFLLSEVVIDIDKLEKLEVENNESNLLLTEVTNLIDKIEKRTRLSEPKVIADLLMDYENVDPDDIILYDEGLWVTDSNSSTVYNISLKSGKVSSVFDRSDGLKKPSYLETDGKILYLYDLDKGLYSVSRESTTEEYQLSPVTGLTPTTLGNVTEMALFKSDGSLYFLIEDEAKIMRSIPVNSGFSYPQVRAEDQSFAGAEDIGITHVIHTLGDNGNFNRFEDNVEIDSAVGKLEDTAKFDFFRYSYVILLDRTQKRVLMLKQPEGSSGLFKLHRQFTLDDSEKRFFQDLKEVVVDVSKNTLYILDGFRIIEISIDE